MYRNAIKQHFLAIVWREERHVSLHPNADEAWARLLQFIDEKLPRHPGAEGANSTVSDDVRVLAVFDQGENFYAIGEAVVTVDTVQ